MLYVIGAFVALLLAAGIWIAVERWLRKRSDAAKDAANTDRDAAKAAAEQAIKDGNEACGKLQEQIAALGVERARLELVIAAKQTDVDRLMRELAARAKPGDGLAGLREEFGGGS